MVCKTLIKFASDASLPVDYFLHTPLNRGFIRFRLDNIKLLLDFVRRKNVLLTITTELLRNPAIYLQNCSQRVYKTNRYMKE